MIIHMPWRMARRGYNKINEMNIRATICWEMQQKIILKEILIFISSGSTFRLIEKLLFSLLIYFIGKNESEFRTLIHFTFHEKLSVMRFNKFFAHDQT